jgi:TetR/AcrR family transcriptional regulator, transcriptional repressor for nem operon
MATTARRVGTETSKTRDALLDQVEKMMLAEGYASISYRALATAAGVTPSLVQYYFPTLDDVFLAAIRRYSERNLGLLSKALESRADDPLRALWQFSQGEATGALMTEFMALGNHRKSIRSEIAGVTERVRTMQLDALPALQLLISGIPKFLSLEEGIGVKTAHDEVTKAFEQYLDSIEPPAAPKHKNPKRRSR